MGASYVGNVFRLIGGSLLGQLVVLAVLPFMARIYSPAEFGFAQALLSFLTIFLIVGSLRLEVAILSVPERDLDRLFRCAWWLPVLLSGIGFLVVAVLVSVNSDWSREEIISLTLLPFLGLFACWIQLMTYLSVRRHAFPISAQAKIIQPTFYGVSALGIGCIHASSASLFLADIFGRVITLVFMIRKLNLGIKQLTLPRYRVVVGTVHRHRELVGIGLFSALLNAAGSAFTVAMLLWLFGAAEAGQYAMIERMIGMPIGLLVGAISQVFMAQLSKSASTGELHIAHAHFIQVLRFQILSCIPLAALIFFATPFVLDVLLGNSWEMAGHYAQALTFLYACSYISGPFNMTLTILGYQRLQLLWDCLRLTIVTLTWGIIWFYALEPVFALWMLSISAIFTYGIHLILANWTLRQPIPIIERFV